MFQQEKNNNIQQRKFIGGAKANSSSKIKLPEEFETKETFQKDNSDSVPSEQRQKLMNKFYKRVKRYTKRGKYNFWALV